MNAIVQFVIKHGYSILFATVFAHQIGLPVPAPLVLLAVGALVAARKLGLLPVLSLSVIACVFADWVWYEAGRRKGDKVLHFLHGFTRDPDAHDRRAKRTFARYGPPLLLIAKFVPGLDAVAPPLSGTSRTTRLRFLTFDALGAILYACAYTGLGYVFSHDLDRAAAYVGRAGRILAGVVFAAVIVYLCARKLLRSHAVRCSFRGVQINPAHAMHSEFSIGNDNGIIKGGNHDH